MKNIYKVEVEQEFNAKKIIPRSLLDNAMGRNRYEDKIYRVTAAGRGKYIYANTKTEAEMMYKQKYPIDETNKIIFGKVKRSIFDYDYSICKDNPQLTYDVVAKVVDDMTIDELRDEVPADIFLEYCEDHSSQVNICINCYS